MSDYSGLGGLVEEIKQASRSIELGDSRMNSRLDGIEKSVNDLYRRNGRPGAEWHGDTDESKSAIEMCRVRHYDSSPKNNGLVTKEYSPSSGEIDEAMVARKAFRQYLRVGDISRLDPTYAKSLSAFSFGGSGFLLPPQQANFTIRCLVDPTDLSGLVDSLQISGPSLRGLIDNTIAGLGEWACDSSCFSGHSNPDVLVEGMGNVEIKPETIRQTICTTRDLIEDASIDVENWIRTRIDDGMRAVINHALILGDGAGKPLGLLSPKAGIPVCETSASTPPGQFSWADLIMLKYEIPTQWQNGSSFVMNQRTLALLLTMQDAMGRPIGHHCPARSPAFVWPARRL